MKDLAITFAVFIFFRMNMFVVLLLLLLMFLLLLLVLLLASFFYRRLNVQTSLDLSTKLNLIFLIRLKMILYCRFTLLILKGVPAVYSTLICVLNCHYKNDCIEFVWKGQKRWQRLELITCLEKRAGKGEHS